MLQSNDRLIRKNENSYYPSPIVTKKGGFGMKHPILGTKIDATVTKEVVLGCY